MKILSQYGDIVFLVVLGYLAVISLVSIITTIVDKVRAAAQRGRRVPENTLMLMGALGGAGAMLITMLMIRHKTKHIKFMLGLPIILVFQAVIALYMVAQIP